jgi:hypothetical protein
MLDVSFECHGNTTNHGKGLAQVSRKMHQRSRPHTPCTSTWNELSSLIITTSQICIL